MSPLHWISYYIHLSIRRSLVSHRTMSPDDKMSLHNNGIINSLFKRWVSTGSLTIWYKYHTISPSNPINEHTHKMCLLLCYLGIDFKQKIINLDGVPIKLQIWDTAGQERFRTLTTAYYRGAMGILLMYDVTNLESFNNLSYWIQNIEEVK